MADELLTEKEHQAIKVAGELAGLLSEIVGEGPSRDADMAELIGSVHHIQRTVAAQASARAYPHLYRLLGGTVGE